LYEAGSNAKKILLQSSTANVAPLVRELEEGIFPDKRIHVTILLLDAPRTTLMNRIKNTTEIDMDRFLEFLNKKALTIEDRTLIDKIISCLSTRRQSENIHEEGSQIPSEAIKKLSDFIQENEPLDDSTMSKLSVYFDTLVLDFLLEKGSIHRQQVIGLERDRLQFLMTHPDLYERTIVLANTEDIDVSNHYNNDVHSFERSTVFLQSLLRLHKEEK
jgi:hypothetical protein